MAQVLIYLEQRLVHQMCGTCREKESVSNSWLKTRDLEVHTSRMYAILCLNKMNQLILCRLDEELFFLGGGCRSRRQTLLRKRTHG